MEIIVSLTILSITMAGLLNVFISAKKHSLRSRSRVSAGELAKYFVDPLQMSVTILERSLGAQNGWGQTYNCLNNCSSSSLPSGCPSVQIIGNMTYTPNYTINDVTGTELKRVKVDITWTTR